MDLKKDFVWNQKDGYAVLEKYTKKYKSARDLKPGEEPEPKETRLVIPSEYDGLPVGEIFDAAFAMNDVIEEVVLPDTVKKMGSMVFNQCAKLKKVTLGKNLERLGYFCFHDTPLVEEEENYRGDMFLIGNWLVGVKDEAKSIEIPSFVTGIADYAFYFNKGLKRIVFPESVERIGMRAFAFELELDEVVIPKTVKQAHWQIFGANVHIKKLTIPTAIYESQKIDETVRIDEIRLI